MPTITESTASIFSAPANSILLHACNAKGSWGAGVAAAFKSHYPAAYRIYHAHCVAPPTAAATAAVKSNNSTLRFHQHSLVGTTLLIPPQLGDRRHGSQSKQKQHWIACLFTSHGYGHSVATADEILSATRTALADLERQIGEMNNHEPGGVGGEEEQEEEKQKEEEGEKFGECCWAVRINSGKFGVAWARSKRVLEEGGLDVNVVRREEDDKENEQEDISVAATAFTKNDEGMKKEWKMSDGGGAEKKRNRGRFTDEEMVGKQEEKTKKRRVRQGGTIDEWLKQR